MSIYILLFIMIIMIFVVFTVDMDSIFYCTVIPIIVAVVVLLAAVFLFINYEYHQNLENNIYDFLKRTSFDEIKSENTSWGTVLVKKETEDTMDIYIEEKSSFIFLGDNFKLIVSRSSPENIITHKGN